MEEIFAIYNEKEKIIGAATRAEAHKKGLWHMVVHCWVVYRDKEDTWLYFQKRAATKKSFPNFYDIASAGHVDVSELHKDAVVREAKEEIGIPVGGDSLYYLGAQKEEFYFEDFLDREIAQIYVYDAECEPKFVLGEEVDCMIRVSQKEWEKKTLKGEKQIEAYLCGEKKKKLQIQEEEWCKHAGEYKKWILPWLKQKKKTSNDD